MIYNLGDKNLDKRIRKTLEIVEKRGYNLTIEQLSKNLIGGAIDPTEIKNDIKNFENIVYDGTFIATIGNLKTKKCMKKKLTNNKLLKTYLKIAKEYTRDLIRFCPWTKCIMLTGSMVTDGLGDNDDIDFNIIVQDGTKYSSYLIAYLLSLKYSIKYRKMFKESAFLFIPKVICISIIWEEHQVKPFIRKDEQVSYELLNTKVLHNSEYFNSILKNNLWLKNWFPQIYDKNPTVQGNNVRIPLKNNKKIALKFIETLSKKIIFSIFKIVRISLSKNEKMGERIDLVEKVKHPYGILDKP